LILETEHQTWEELGSRERPSWYLHPLVAGQKRAIHLDLIRRWTTGLRPLRVLKTDLFEEAFGGDRVLADVAPNAGMILGMDAAFTTARAAARRNPGLARGLVAMDIRRPGFADGCLDLVISTSTLDHFATREDFVESLKALARMLRPGGRLVLTLDNPWNPLFHPLRWLTQRPGAPFPIGYSPLIGRLCRDLEEAGLHVEDRDWIIHNPRLVSTALFVAIDRTLGRSGDPLVRALLWMFSLLGRLPTRRFTACFQAVKATKRAG